jgi:hypothetical protein
MHDRDKDAVGFKNVLQLDARCKNTASRRAGVENPAL